ncbi:thioredoxin family protein [Clostridia bacterium]|nr:thioredoxin family protein [Clostridia bacterium]
MGKISKGIRLLVLLITSVVILFSAYNFGLIGQVYSGRELESQALSAKEPYVLYFYSDACLVSQTAKKDKQALSENLEALSDFRWVDINVENEGEMAFAWKKQIQVTPTLLFYARDGRLIGHYSGKIDWEAAEAELAEELVKLQVQQEVEDRG